MNCRECGTKVIRVTTTNGKTMPLNATPDLRWGDYFIAAAADDNGASQRLAIHIKALTKEGQDKAFRSGLRLYRSHLASCSARKVRSAA